MDPMSSHSEFELVPLVYTTSPPSGHDAAEVLAAKRQNANALNGTELRWRHYQPWLKHRAGYDLRPRYRADWEVPQQRAYAERENCLESRTTKHIIDATRVSDGVQVCIKAIKEDADVLNGLEIWRYLSSDALMRDPRNHTVPLLDVFSLPIESREKALIMPLLRRWNDPRFDTVDEVLEFFRQVIEGLHFMHEHNIAHGDCTYPNIMYDATPMYPDGFHPLDTDRTINWNGKAKHYTRTQRPVRYRLIDFGLAVRCEDKATAVVYPDRGTVGHRGYSQYPHPPELSDKHVDTDIPHNPFPTDVWYLGNFIRVEFIEGYTSFGFMGDLVADMMKEDPAERPTMDEVVARFHEIHTPLRALFLRRPLARRFWHVFGIPTDWHIPAALQLVMMLPRMWRTVKYALFRTPAVPTATTPHLANS